LRRDICLKYIRFESTGEKGVIHTEEHIRKRRVFCQDGFIKHSASIAALQKDDSGIVRVFKRFDNIFTDGK
jgi:hypothetical protein